MFHGMSFVRCWSTDFEPHHEDVAGVQPVAAEAPGHVLVGDSRLFSFLECKHAGDGHALDILDYLRVREFRSFGSSTCSEKGISR